jgi:hypothetical protein
MTVFLITYTSTHQQHAIHHETEWVCDPTYDRDRARKTFQDRFPTAAVVHCKPVN